MNIGLEVLSTPAAPQVCSIDSILDSYTSCEALFLNTDRFTEYGTQLFTSFDNVVSLWRTAKRFGSSESLAVINDLVREDFHGSFSLEVAQGYANTIWGKIKAFFAKIWNWIKMFFTKITTLFSKVDGRLKKLLNDLKTFGKQGDNIKEWRYIGLPPVYNNLSAVFKAAAAKIDGAASEDALKKITATSSDGKGGTVGDGMSARSGAASFSNSVLVKTVSDSIAKVNAVIGMLGTIDTLRKDVEKDYNVAKNKVDNMAKKATEADIAAAKLVMHKANAKVKWVNATGKLVTRSAMSILANCKVKAAK